MFHQQAPSFLTVSEKTETREWMGRTDADIWKEFKKGSRSALIHIYTLHFPTLFNYALQFDADRENVKDHIQDLFIYLYKHRETINETDSIKFYLFKCLRRRIKVEHDKLLKLKMNGEQPLYESSPELDFILQEELLRNKEILNKAIIKLPQKQQEIIYYYYYHDFTYREIAGIMGFTQVKTARKLLYRALDGLKSVIDFSILFAVSVLMLV